METSTNYRDPASSLIATDGAAIQRHDHRRAEWGLHNYALLIAAGLDLGRESVYCEVDSHAVAYIALDQRLPHLPQHDAALLWNSHNGWAVGVEYPNGIEVLVLDYFGDVLLPDPCAVVLFAKSALAGRGTGRMLPPQPRCPDLMNQLTEYAARR